MVLAYACLQQGSSQRPIIVQTASAAKAEAGTVVLDIPIARNVAFENLGTTGTCGSSTYVVMLILIAISRGHYQRYSQDCRYWRHLEPQAVPFPYALRASYRVSRWYSTMFHSLTSDC
jgi:hypothetical protein